MSQAQRYRKRPVTIEALQFTGTNGDEIAHFAGLAAVVTGRTHALHIKTPEGLMRAAPGDWIIKGVSGEFYPCKPDIFAATYEAVEDAEDRTSGLSFSEALTAAKSGRRILRTDWNGTGFWVRVFTPEPGSDLTAPFLAIEYPPGHPAYPSGHLGPWLISPTDAMAEDWMLLD